MSESKNFFLITVDDLRRDRTSLENERDTTPFLREFSEENHYQSDHYSNASTSPSSFRSIFSSTYPHQFRDYDYLSEGRPYLPEILSSESINTAGLSTNPFVSEYYGFHQGYDSFKDVVLDSSHEEDGFIQQFENKIKSILRNLPVSNELRMVRNRLRGRSTPYMEADEVVEEAKTLIEQNKGSGSSFYWFHFMDTHSPFVPPEEVSGKWSEFESQLEIWKNLDEEDPEQLLELYDECLLYLDRNLRNLVEFIEQSFDQEYEIIITSDHGELFYDEDWGAHGHPSILKEKLFEVPLFSTFQPARDFSTHIDIVPTILDYFSIEYGSEMQGKSLISDEGKTEDFIEANENDNMFLDEKWREHRVAKVSSDGIGNICNLTRGETPDEDHFRGFVDKIASEEDKTEDISDLTEDEEEKVKQNLKELGYSDF